MDEQINHTKQDKLPFFPEASTEFVFLRMLLVILNSLLQSVII